MPYSQHDEWINCSLPREEVQAALDFKRNLQTELDSHLVEAQADVRLWLRMMIDDLQEEKADFERFSDIADGELGTAWNLLQESIGRLRAAQNAVKVNELAIADLLADLADDDLWKLAAA